MDTLNILKSDSRISLLNRNNQIILKTKILNIDGSNADIEDPIREEDLAELEYGCRIYPMFKIVKKVNTNENIISIDNPNLLDLNNVMIAFR
jgi:hypothetical protein